VVATVEQKGESAMMEKTELRSDIRALDENEIDFVAGGVDSDAAARAVAAFNCVIHFGGHPIGWAMAAYGLL
jgi:hypothetical protein